MGVWVVVVVMVVVVGGGTEGGVVSVSTRKLLCRLSC